MSASLTQLQQKSLCSRFRRQNEQQYRSPRLPPVCSASIREVGVALSVGHPRGTHSRYVIGCCLIPLGICGLKNNSRRITCGMGVYGGCLLCPLYPLLVSTHLCSSVSSHHNLRLHKNFSLSASKSNSSSELCCSTTIEPTNFTEHSSIQKGSVQCTVGAGNIGYLLYSNNPRIRT